MQGNPWRLCTWFRNGHTTDMDRNTHGFWYGLPGMQPCGVRFAISAGFTVSSRLACRAIPYRGRSPGGLDLHYGPECIWR